MEVLLFLVQRRGELVTREQLVEKIWGKDVISTRTTALTARYGRSGRF
jgi:DNA-binding winged helix-turn-helix (wHTH) protein